MSVLVGCHAHFPAPVPSTDHLQQHEITAATNLLDGQGQLIEPGWARQPLPRFAAQAVQHNPKQLRQWDYYSFMDGQLLIEITVANIRFAAFCSVLINDIRDPAKPVSVMAARGVLKPRKVIQELPEDQEQPVSCHDGNGQTILQIFRQGKDRVFEVAMPKTMTSKAVSGKLVIEDDRTRDSYVGVFPFTELEGGFFYENKVPGMPAKGFLVADGQRFELGKEAFAVRDWGRGVWPEKLVWQWGMAGGTLPDGRRVDFNLGAGFGDTRAGTENIIFVDGVAHKLTIVNWDFDRKDRMQPWQMTSPGNDFAATMTPVYEQPLSANLIFKGVKIHKAYGHFAGHAVLDDGSTLEFSDLFGFMEEVYIRW